MKVKMLKSIPGSTNGIKVQMYNKDEVYDLDGSLLDVFLKIKAAVPVEEKMTSPPSNKSVKVEENKNKEDEEEPEKEESRKRSRK